jgi:hypothetical protein
LALLHLHVGGNRVGCYQSMRVAYLRRAGFAKIDRVAEHGLFDDASSSRVGQTLISLNLVATKAAARSPAAAS